MNNRLLSFLILVILFGGVFGAYYYFFIASVASVSVVLSSSGSTSVTLVSEFGKNYARDCERTCLFSDIPAVDYTVSAKRDGYISVNKTFALPRGKIKNILLVMEKEAILTEQRRRKEETISVIKLKKDIREVLETNIGWIALGYRADGFYYALPDDVGWIIFIKKEWSETKELFKIPSGTLTEKSLDTYEGYIALGKKEKTVFYSLKNGQETIFNFSGKILGIKDTLNADTKIITGENGVFMYAVSDRIARENPLYDDIVQLTSGEIVVLVKKTSKTKQSLLSLTDFENDSVFLIGQDTRERRMLLKTPKNGKLLRYKNGEVLFVSYTPTDGDKEEIFVVENME